MRLLVKLPTRSRPKKFFEVLSMYRSMASGKHGMTYVVTCDEDDATMTDPSVRYRLEMMPDVHAYWGRHKTKVQAVNADVDRHPDWDVLVVASDDMIPQEWGYDDAIAGDMAKHFPDLCGVLWYNDGFASTKVCTIPIMGRNYYTSVGSVYHKAYTSLWCDNDMTETARMLGQLVYIDRVIIRHEHPANVKKVRVDALYKRNNRSNAQDRKVFERRSRERFGLVAK